MPGPVREADGRQQLRYPPFPLIRRPSRQQQGQGDVLRCRQPRDEMEELEHETDLVPAGTGLGGFIEAGDVVALQPVVSRAGPVQEPQDVQQGGLARTRGAHDGEVFTCHDVQVDAGQGEHSLRAHEEGT